MTDTVFVQGTVVQPAWLNDVNTAVYHAGSATPGTVARSPSSKFSETVSVRDFGAVGDGVTDDTAAINACFAYCNQEAAGYIANPPDFFKLTVKTVYFPSGDYVYSGTGITATSWLCAVRGDHKSTTRLRITSNVYLMTATAGVMFFGLCGMHIYGGKGTFTGTFTAANTLSQMYIHDNLFFNYTECAIGHLSQDFPHWHIKGNQFHGALVAGERVSFGVCLSGRSDGSIIEDNEFQENKVNVKLAFSVNGTVASNIRRNIFERWTTSPGSLPSYDLWIVPSTAAPTVVTGAGVGTMIEGNRFGNENLLTVDYHMLIADENTGAGTSPLNYLPSFSASAKFVGGLQVRGNIVFGTGASSTAFCYSTTPNIWASVFDNVANATPIRTLDILPASVNDASNVQYATNYLRQQHVGGPSFFLPAPSSIYSGPFDDPTSIYQSWNTVPAYWRTGYDASVLELTNQFVASFTTGSGSLSNVTDAAGGNEAVEFTASALNGFMATATNALTVGRLGYVSFDIKTGSSLPLPYIRVAFTDNSGSANAIVDRLVGVNTQWRRVTIPFCMNAASAVNTLQFQATAYSAGVNTKIQIGRVRVYHAQEAVHPFTKALDSGLVSYTIGAVGAGATVNTTVAVVGAVAGDFAIPVYGAPLNGMIQTAQVTSTNVVTVYTYNPSGGTITPAVNGLRVRVFKAI